jgi:hypothetical protein
VIFSGTHFDQLKGSADIILHTNNKFNLVYLLVSAFE